jgi:oxygen-dependent protoporphyrinogen oxidase
LGTIWTSSIFSGRSPEGMIQLRTMIGGATDPDAAGLSQGELLDVVTADLHPIMGITGEPVYIRIFTWDRGIPQFTIGHPERMARMDMLLQDMPGLAFTGNAYDGIGLNDCVVRSEKVVTEIAAYLSL